MVPFIALAPLVFLFGAIIGSFASVLVCRMHTGTSLNKRSHCLSCGRTLTWYELVPVLSFLTLRGRCRTCTACIPRRDFLFEVLSGAMYVGIVWIAPDMIAVVLFAFLGTTLLITATYDWYHLIVPEETIVAALFGAFSFLVYRVIVLGDPLWVIPTAIAAGIAAWLAYAALWYVSKGRWIGFGDAKLAFPLGMAVGLAGIFSMVVLSFWIGAVITVVAMGVQSLIRGGQRALLFRGTPLRMKSEVPFAPFLILAFVMVFAFGIDVLSLITYVFP